MNAVFKIVCLVGLILGSTTSCVKVIDIPTEAFRPQVVVRGTLNPDSLLSVQLSYSLRPDTAIKYQPINEAKVLFYENDALIGNLAQGKNGLFRLNYKPVRGRKYGIKVQVANREEVSAEDVIPQRPITSLRKLDISPDNPNANPNLELRIGKNNASNHWFSAYTPQVLTLVSPDLQTTIFPMVNYLNILSNSPYLDRFNSFFDGFVGRYTFGDPVRIDMRLYNLTPNAYIDFSFNNQVKKGEQAFVYVYTMSDTYDRYLKSAITAYQNRLFSSSGAINNPFAEPSPVYSNIKNGVGIWAAYSVERFNL
jgi:hypothetical protein